ncbi:MAG: response regulator [Flavobacteriales bacterium]|nr:response regulator [Flavobacteriales bacterium]
MMNKVLKVFIVEDSSVMSNAIKKHLIKEFKDKLEIYQFNTVEKVLVNNQLFPDIMLLDHYLQESNGVDSIPIILETFERLKIAIISGQNDFDVFTTAYNNGASDYIRKDALFFHQVSDFINSQL